MSRRFIAIEMSACRDPADDTPLLSEGIFGVGGAFSEKDVAVFWSAHSALNSASQALNARPGCMVTAIAQGRKVTA